MSKKRLEIGQIWTREAIPSWLSEQVGLPKFGPERALVLEVNNSWVRYRRDCDVNAKPTHALRLSKFLRLFEYVGVLFPPPSTPIPAACAQLQ